MDRWERCYSEGWKDVIVEEAFAHPAKFARGLIRRIYAHAKEQGWFKPGDYVLDPFGGVALGGLEAMTHELNWIGVELEQKFVDLGSQNIDRWNHQLRGWPNLGTARIVRGDSRRIGEVVKEAGLIVSSQEHDDVCPICKQHVWIPRTKKILFCMGRHGHDFDEIKINADIIISSGPYPSGGHHPDQTGAWGGLASHKGFADKETAGYGDTPGQLGKMKEGDIPAVIGSPNFPTDQPCPSQTMAKKDYHAFTRGDGTKRDHEMRTEANLATMREGDISAVISSPPYEGTSPEAHSTGIDLRKNYETYRKSGGGSSWEKFCASRARHQDGYGKGNNQLGNSSGETFWAASREIVQGCYDLLKPGGESVPDGEGIDFCEGHHG